ncbi:hypothetical protein AB3Y40_16905 [Yoonia sp. R2331]|uniref:hypothetical protein n=1 Tax=Yoonia sp. R2331 TaxID=3237238 RepID=UPI0034E49B25
MFASIELNGPFPRSLWKRFRRRPRYLGTAAVAVGVFVAASVEPNLSGQWVNRADRSEVIEVYHVGRTLRANFVDGSAFFEVRADSETAFSGLIDLVWMEEDTIDRCGLFSRTVDLDVTTFNEPADRLRVFYRAGLEIGSSCRADSSRPTEKTFVRRP